MLGRVRSWAGMREQATMPAFIFPNTMRVGSKRPSGVWIARSCRDGPGANAKALYMENRSVFQYHVYPGNLANSSVPLGVVGTDLLS